MSEHTQHQKRPSSGGKKGHTKGLKPNPESRRKSSGKHPKGDRSKDESEDDFMASFPQYCANCEKQIFVPDHRILFCSAECKRQDRQSRTSSIISFGTSPPRTPLRENLSFDSLSRYPQFVQQRSPSYVNMPFNRNSTSSLSSIERHTSDEDSRPQLSREPSEASRWLGSFRNGSESTTSNKQHDTPRKPKLARGNSATPSLIHTPTSYSTTGMSLPYTPRSMSTVAHALNGGPLPPRNNPYSPSSFGSKSTDLVTPMSMLSMTAPEALSSSPECRARKAGASIATSQGTVVQGELLSYEKKSVLRDGGRDGASGVSPSSGSLKQLFSFAAMQSAPTPQGGRSPLGSPGTPTAIGAARR